MNNTTIQHNMKDIKNDKIIQSEFENTSDNEKYILDYYCPYNYTNTSIEINMKKSYWDDVYTDILKGAFSSLLNILLEMKQMIKDLVPNRKDIHTELNEYIDIPFIKQKLEHNVFDTDEFINLFCYYINWVLQLGSPKDDNKMNNLREKVINISKEKGHMYILPYAYDTLHTQLVNIKEDAIKYKQTFMDAISP